MSYWKCTGTKISDDGTSLEIAFKDEHSCSSMTTTLPSEVWKDILIFRCAFEEPERRAMEVHKRLCQYLWNEAELAVKKCKEGSRGEE